MSDGWGATRRRRRAAGLRRAGAVFAAIALTAPPAWASMQSAGAAPHSNTGRSSPVQIQVVDVNPTAPGPSPTSRPLTVTLSMINTTGSNLSKVKVVGYRGDPAESQASLDTALHQTTLPSQGFDVAPRRPITVDLPADGIAHPVTFSTTVGIPNGPGLCQCAAHAVYPLYFAANDAAGNRLGTTATYLPSFFTAPQPVRVSWLWPLIDRPHRLTDSTVFTDDALAALVGPDGRLDRALTVAEQVARHVPLTLVIDPELLDELEVMSTGHYTVRAADTAKPVSGAGQQVASDWLGRLHALLQTYSTVQVQLTPYADPDIQSLLLQGLDWRTAMPADMTARVTQALPGRSLDYTVAWPAGGAYTGKALRALADRGVRTVVLPATALNPRDGADETVPVGTARLSAGGHAVAAAVTSPAAQGYVASAVSRRQDGATKLPQLVAEIAIRAAQEPDAEHVMVLTPPRYVDPDVTAARRAILDTSSSAFAKPISLPQALDTPRLPADRSQPAPFPSSAATLPAQVIRSASDVAGALPAVDSLLAVGGAAAAASTATLPVALQRTESSYWLRHATTGAAFAAGLVQQINAITSGVYIVTPSSGAYTLGSSTSPLPVTVRNTLGYPVQVRLQVKTRNGLPGFRTAHDIGVQRIDKDSRRTLHLPTVIARSGRIAIEAQLLTPRNQALGGPVDLSVHSTALGIVGVVITIAAGAVLLLALLVRVIRRFRRRPVPPVGPVVTGSAT